MPHKQECNSQHRVLFVDEWSPLGAFVTCICGAEFHVEQPLLDEAYLSFIHNSPAGPEFDLGMFVLTEEVE